MAALKEEAMKNIEQVKELINRIADSYDMPSDEQAAEMRSLTGEAWSAEDLQELCCGYWSHHSLEETAYFMFHGSYPPVHEVELVFWRYKQGVALDDRAVYEKYRFGRGALKALEALPLEEILQNIREILPGWLQKDGDGKYWCFECPGQADARLEIFEYGRETEARREHQILRFSCHNMGEEAIKAILACMEGFSCTLHIREEKKR